MSIYLFSILNNVGVGFVIISFLITIPSLVLLAVSISLYYDYYDNGKMCKSISKQIKIYLSFFIIGLFLFFFVIFIPSQDSLIKSYIVINGKNQLTKGNIEKVIKFIDKKSDRIIDSFKERKEE